MSQSWMRHFGSQLVDSKGNTTDFGSFKGIFTTDRFNLSNETRADTFKIHNLSADTVDRIIREEFSRIRVIAGYNGIAANVPINQAGVAKTVNPDEVGQMNGRGYGLVFDGEIQYIITGKDNLVDSFILIQTTDSDRAFATSIITQTLAVGYTVSGVNVVLVKDFDANGVMKGNIPTMPAAVFPRGRVLFGTTRYLMNNVAEQCKADWMFVDGKREMAARNEVVREIIKLDSTTGLVGIPQQTIGNDVNVRRLTNPSIRANGLVELNQTSVFHTALGNSDITMTQGRITGQNNNGNVTIEGTTTQPTSIATDGVYAVRDITYTGDTGDQARYMDMMCEARGTMGLKAQPVLEGGAG